MKTEKLVKKTLILRNYQEPIFQFAIDHRKSIVVLALCPGGGKTEVAISVIVDTLKKNSKARVLVLTHSTNILKKNFMDRMNDYDLPFNDYGTDFNPKHRVHISLPNSEDKINGYYDLVIIDEAHENYLAKRMQRIIQEVKPKKQILLTGTPSVFIKRKEYDGNIYVLAANEISTEHFAKLQIELVETTYNWKKFYNNDLTLKTSVVLTKDKTDKALHNIFESLLDRLKYNLSVAEFNKIKLLPKLTGKGKEKLSNWFGVYNKIGKTIIYCYRQNQADDVYNVLKKHGVDCLVSHGRNDPNGIEIDKFTDYQDKHQVLIVVGRATLGYNNVNLMNIIDMTGTHNPNEIYQMFARVLRGGPEMQKFYMKLTTQESGMKDLTKVTVCGALMLTDKKYLSMFNGSNFNGIMIPYIKNTRVFDSKHKNPKKYTSNSNEKDNSKIKKYRLPEFTNDIIDFFKGVILETSNKNKVSIYGLTTIGDVRAELSDKTIWTEEKLELAAMGLDY